MSAALLDTNLVSVLFRQNTIIDRYLPHLKDKVWSISFVTVAELAFGMEKGAWSEARRSRMAEFMSAISIIEYERRTVDAYARVRLHREKIGRPTQFEDLWIAATAISHGIPLLSHNRKDFDDIPRLKLICYA